MAGLKKTFVTKTPISSSEMNNNFDVLDSWEIKNEDLTAQITGANLIFTTVYTYVSGSLIVLVDGIRQRKNTHYTESSNQTFTFTAGMAPQPTQDVVCDYRRSDI